MNRSTWSPQFMRKWLLLTLCIAIPCSLLMHWSVAQFEPWWFDLASPETNSLHPYFQGHQEVMRNLQIATVFCAILIAAAIAFELLKTGLRPSISLGAVSPFGWTIAWFVYGVFHETGRASILFPFACLLPLPMIILAFYFFLKGGRRWLSAIHLYAAMTFFVVLSMQLFFLNIAD